MLLAAAWLPGAAGAQELPAAPGSDEAAEVEAGQEDGQEQAAPEDLATTGDAWVDAQMADIDRYGRRHRNAFIDEMARYQGAPRGPVAELLDEGGWTPGELYFACALASVTGRSCRFIADQRGQPPAVAWVGLASGLNAGPGSEAFSRLKRGIVHSYQRWARPLSLDAEMAEAFPDHVQPPAAPHD